MSETKFEVDKEKLEVRISRVFNAPPEKVWRAYTDPELIAQWWQNTEIDKYDLRVGGAWRFIDRGQGDGKEHAFRGEFTEIDEPHKLARTFEYEPWAGHVMNESVTLEPTGDGKTQMVTVSKYANLEDLENMVKSGMERGATAGVERLAKVVEA